MRSFQDLVEEHWIAVGVAVSVGGALTFSVILAVIFNVITTRAAAGV